MRGCSGGYETRLHCKTGCYSTLITGGPARPLGYLRAETPTRGESAGPSTPGPP